MIAEPTTNERVSLMPAWGYVPAGSDFALRRLVRAVIIQAGRDARSVTEYKALDARAWLLSEDCALYCEFSGVNFLAVKEWVNAGCKDWDNEAERITDGTDDSSY